MNPQVISDQQIKGRKPHRCFCCGRDIVKGETHRKCVLKLDDIYTLRTHNDCEDATNFIIKFHGLRWYDFDDAPLYEIISDDFEANCNTLRGRFPHVVARLELGRELENIRWEKKQPERRRESVERLTEG